mmetsp:Transcript_4168/g.8578  ORF Transcript_4168/g.8578 Transcript_4168/m.8578 type:complete len:259 (-) Transcript_4168:226-1002(-)|eukprot:CAMPEP_0118933660 /NCGR_PEP_ID=MMETSP1169-20130426/12117_1 /TAXON_ID=36882 /ORGANISM="Pyramimonas obovata, Strain CCMP722" /LENGTH=258 /DNA_ID=CAMNT_0006876453 /DNA_START=96 /DNA_END=872 /DNA_ORIENTATION=+
MAGYASFALILLQCATFAWSASPNGHAFLPRSLLMTEECDNACAPGEVHQRESQGRVSESWRESCTCTQVILIQATLSSTLATDEQGQVDMEKFYLELRERALPRAFDAIAVTNLSSVVADGTNTIMEILLFLPIPDRLKFTDEELQRFKVEDLAVQPYTLGDSLGTLHISLPPGSTWPAGGGEGVPIPSTPTPQAPTPRDPAADRGMDDEGDASLGDVIYVIIGVIFGVVFLCGTTLGFIKYQRVKKAKLATSGQIM